MIDAHILQFVITRSNMCLGITVHNNFTENFNGTAIHWHGIRQVNTNWLDGVPGVTQCPSKVGKIDLKTRMRWLTSPSRAKLRFMSSHLGSMARAGTMVI